MIDLAWAAVIAFVAWMMGVGMGAGWVYRLTMRLFDEYEMRQDYERMRDSKP